MTVNIDKTYSPAPLVPPADWTALQMHAHSVRFYEDDSFLLDELIRFIGCDLGGGAVGTFVALPAYPLRFLPPLQALVGMDGNLATVRVSLRRVSAILDEPVDVQEAPEAIALDAVQGDIAFEDVTVSFGRARKRFNAPRESTSTW